jgi:hypothetical protein
MNDILEFIEDLEMLDVLHDAGKEAHIEFLLAKYRDKVEQYEADMEREYQYGFDFAA